VRRRNVLALVAAVLVAAAVGAATLLTLRDDGRPPATTASSAEKDADGASQPADGEAAPPARRAPRVRAAAPPATSPESTPPVAAPPGATARPVRAISGRVRTASGDPVAGATVRVYRGPPRRLVTETRTGDDGSFVAPDVPFERVGVRVEPTVRNGGATFGEWVEVAARAEGPLEVVTRDAGVAAGRVVGADGSAVPGADLTFHWVTHAPGFHATQSDAEGRFAVAIPKDEATYVLAEASTLGIAGRRWAIGYAAIPAGGADGIEIRCAEGKRVSGRVVDGSGRPLAGVRLRFAVQVTQRPTLATSQEDGTITCGGLDDARYYDVALDPADTARAGLVLSPETVAPGAPDAVTFRVTEPATARGVVRDASGAPVANWKVTITATDGGMERLVRTDAEGRFVAERLVPGRYKVRVTWVPFRERERTHVVGEVDTGAAEAQFTFPEMIVR